MKQVFMSFSVRYVLLGFLALVALCAVFFSLGFLTGYNERTASVSPTVERVALPEENLPPLPPPETGKAESSTSRTPTSSPAEQTSADTTAPTEAPAGPALGDATSVSKGSASTPTPPFNAARGMGPGITIQVAASHDRQDAEALVSVLKARGYPVFLMAPENGGAADNLFRVEVGPFGSRQEAEKVRQKLVQEGFKPFLRR